MNSEYNWKFDEFKHLRLFENIQILIMKFSNAEYILILINIAIFQLWDIRMQNGSRFNNWFERWMAKNGPQSTSRIWINSFRCSCRYRLDVAMSWNSKINQKRQTVKNETHCTIQFRICLFSIQMSVSIAIRETEIQMFCKSDEMQRINI